MVFWKGKRSSNFRSLLYFMVALLCTGVIIHIWKPFSFSFILSYVKLIIFEISSDHRRYIENDFHLGDKEWRLYKLESRFGQEWCKFNGVKHRKDYTWLTSMVNDDFAIPALVLGHSIQKFSCQKNMIAMVTVDVTEGARIALRKVGWDVKIYESMDCDWLERKLGRPEKHEGYLGTHTRFHAWKFTQFSKILYVDPDYMPMTNIDELFEIEGDFAAATCGRPGVLDPCFNAGLLVFRPDVKAHDELIELWMKIGKSHCINDQVLLWHYYADQGNYIPLPYTYNVRRIVYRPMKGFHFACCVPPKPWSAACRPNRKEAALFDMPITDVSQLAVLFWKNLYEALDKNDLNTWWNKKTIFTKPKQEYGNRTSEECWKNSMYIYYDSSL